MVLKKILLIGRSGQIGSELFCTLSTLGSVIAPNSRELDICNLAKIRAVIQEIKPDVIVNAAAYTAVDQAEKNIEATYALNAEAPKVLAEEAKKNKSLLVHYSTDYVFDGLLGTYQEDDIVNPQSVYGTSKQKGEEYIRNSGCNHLILRTSWVYGAYRNNFYLTMCRLAKEHKEIRVVNDQMGCPTWSFLIALATSQILAQEKAYAGSESGTYHLCSNGSASWYDFAKEILKDTPVKVTPITTSEFPTLAMRPKDSRMNCEKLEKHFGVMLPDWKESFELFRSRL